MTTLYTVGIDEVGRGPIAGPLVVCACAAMRGIDLLSLFPGGELKDSKKLSEKHRLAIISKVEPYVESSQVLFGLGEITAERIDEIGLALSIQEATAQALTSLHKKGVPKNVFIFLDGSLKADPSYEQETIIKGDEKIIEIALASIIAKVNRDTFMKKIAGVYPKYGFEKHVGYGTKAHYDAIEKYGLTPLHRRLFLKNSKHVVKMK
jgi:ribonuclease HII